MQEIAAHKTRGHKNRWMVLVGAMACAAGCFLVFLSLIFPWEGKLRSDEKLLANYRTHQAEFQQLAAMFQEDANISGVWSDGVAYFDSQGPAMTAEGVQEYRELMSELGIAIGMYGSEDRRPIWLVASATGISVSGREYGYVYGQDYYPRPQAEDLERYRAAYDSYIVYRRINSEWCVYLEVK